MFLDRVHPGNLIQMVYENDGVQKTIFPVVNGHYDGKDLLEVIEGMIHQKYPDQEYRNQRCIEMYGRLI